jgi:precorrin-2/cobalt-factor-2 C20-methyltransferase
MGAAGAKCCLDNQRKEGGLIMAGILYGVGVGPGDAGLITEKARQILSITDVLCLPLSAPGRESVALRAVKPYLPAGVKTVELLFPMSKDKAELEQHQRAAAARVDALLSEYKVVTFVTIGDPLLYSTFGYLLACLRRICPEARVEVVPGVSSFNAAAALLQLPLAEGDERLAVFTAPVSEEEVAACAPYIDTLVILKISADFERTLDLLAKLLPERQVCLASRLGGEDEFFATDAFTLRGQTVDYLSLLIVRKRGTKT